jgi:8-oxo-dGTP pyrophosphatase MutT (NUDIX family)
MSDLPRHSVSVTAVVFHEDGRVLAIRREDDGRWVPSGGVVELDETPEQAVVREVLEETGVQVKPDVLTGVYKSMIHPPLAPTFDRGGQHAPRQRIQFGTRGTTAGC